MSKKKVKTVIKLQLQAGKATPAPPVGTALGPHGLNIMEFCKAYNERTANMSGVIPAQITVFEDRTFSFITKTPPASELLKKAAGVEKGSGNPEPRQGRLPLAGATARDRRGQAGRPQRPRPRACHQDHRGHGPVHGSQRQLSH